MQAHILPILYTTTSRWVHKVKTFFSEEGQVAYQIKENGV